jgi:hypothetical protein
MFAAFSVMATKKVRTDKKGSKTVKNVDPFAVRVESSTSAAPEKPKRAIKVIKAAKLINAAKGVNATNAPSRPASDAFAEIAAPTPKSEEPTPRFTADVADTKNIKARTTKEIEKLFGPKVGKAETVSTPDVPHGKRTKAAAPKKTRPTVATSNPITVAKTATLPDVTAEIAATEPKVEMSPVFKALADVELPVLPRENRARLLMQSPTRLYLYWSLRQNPWQQLRAVFGPDLGSYTLVLKLRNLTTKTEEIQRVETEGEWWFNNVEPDSEYVVEIGFYATNRPYFRMLYSNTVTTPRRSPSPHPATEARWTVSATRFAEVLDASGFTRDAVDVAIAGDDHLDAAQRTNLAFADLLPGAEYSTKGISAEDMRHAILALAGGATLDVLRDRVSSSLFNVLESYAERLSSSGARRALTEHFDVEESEWTEEQFGPTVFGASLVNFPKTLKSRQDTKYSPRYNPFSSFSIGR